MSNKRPIFWRQGTFLEPQHFQLLELQQRNDLSAFLGAVIPWPWGFTSLKLNDDALQNYDLEILELDLWLPNGRRLVLPDNVLIRSQSFRKVWTNPDEHLEVALTIPHFSETTPNVVPESLEGSQPEAAERLFTALVPQKGTPDLLGDGPPSMMDTLQYNATLVFGADAKGKKEGHYIIPLARLYREGERPRLTTFQPPTLNIWPESPLHQVMVDIGELVRAKARQLEEFKVSPAQTRTQGSGGSSLSLVISLVIISRHISRLHNLASSSALHPYHAFGALRELVADLTIFAPGISALGEPLNDTGKALPPYDHMDPYPSFLETRNLASRLLDTINPGPELNLSFRRDHDRFHLDFPAWMDMNFVCWVSLHQEGALAEAGASLVSYGKLSSPARLDSILGYNLPGIALTPLKGAPVGLPRKPDTTYFAIRREDPLWEEALKSGHLTLFWDNAPEQCTLSLMGNRI
ncbi:MAG: type VI secretion system baseplate subunit TssK [Deltaproteobacteria bacterium]|jgi:type VI secretion system protein ImpJ|nr:type VI secretion system baseplate subunit TssK [Deltaproteobacteria bacterium]